MDITTLKKKLNTYVTEKGQLRNVSDELLFEFITAWEAWTGTAKEFYRAIGFSYRQMGTLMGKAKRLKREGYFGNADFKEVKVEGPLLATPDERCTHIELQLEGKVIRFPSVPQLVEFLQKAG